MPAELFEPLALAAGLAWAAGLRVYGVVFCVGMAGHFGLVALPGNLNVLTHPAVMTVSGLLFFLEFFADKIPYVDSVWDALNTFVRAPGGALLAALAMADGSQGMMIAAALLGGVIAGGTHVAKAGSRAAINASPEPVSNWLASFSEDGAAFGILALALTHPLLLLAGLVLFVLILLWLLPKLLRLALGALRAGFRRLRPQERP
ncbi:MAG: DUF4126 domain-containing protein [Pseudomonadota bacterium]|jgi:hypothetical protein